MKKTQHPLTASLRCLLAGTLAILTCGTIADRVAAGTAPKQVKSPLRVCAAANEAPYSSRDGNGFENRIAELVAGAMGRSVEFVWSERPAIYLVRDQLDKNTCDVVIGIDTGDPRVLTTKPYYRAPYVFVERTDTPLDITSFDDPDLLKVNKIGYVPGTPVETMMTKLGLYSKNFNYVKSLTNYKSPRNQYIRIDPNRLVSEVADGTADLAIAFAPEVARYVKQHNNKLKMVIVPDNNTRVDGERVPFHFDQSFGVRKDNPELRDELNGALDKVRLQIHAVLEEEGIPLLMPSNQSSKS